MPRLISRNPAYRLHKPSGQAVVTLNGQDIYLGAYGSPESRREYDRVIAEWLARGRQSPGSDTHRGSVCQVAHIRLEALRWNCLQ